jgi:hypothetical protein
MVKDRNRTKVRHLIDLQAQKQIASLVDSAVEQILAELASHGTEEGLTSALGHALMLRKIEAPELTVRMKYRQHNKITEEPYSGADGAFFVKVETPDAHVEKAALFQAKLLRGHGDLRKLRMSKQDAERLKKQSSDMLRHTDDAVAVFYTWKNIYVVDASDYESDGTAGSLKPLSQEHQLITLGTYLGKWLPRCTKGDQSNEILTHARHIDGFRNGISLDIVSQQPSVPWEEDSGESAWRRSGKRRTQ